MRVWIFALIISAWGAAPWRLAVANDVPGAVAQAEQSRVAAIAKAVPSAVAIFTADGNGGGSGVVVSKDGYAVSNFHVAAPVGDYMKCGMADGRMYDAVIVGIDPTGDVALIKLLGREDFTPAEMADSNQVRVGDWCFAVGNPFLLATDLQPTVTFGIVSGVHRYQYPAGSILEYADCIQTDAAINPGNSGGPLFDAQGRLIGIVGRGSFEKRGRVNVGVGYAISINQVKNFLGSLHSGRVVDHATLGATVDRDEKNRVIVSNILESSDAFRRGLRYGDEVLEFGGRPISSVNTFKNVLGIYPKGWRVPLTYRRNDERREVYVRLTGVHTEAQLWSLLNRQQPADEIPPEKTPGKEKDKPKSKSPGQPQPPRPIPSPHSPDDETPVEVPAEIAKLIQPKTGFKNFYFNELNRSRVWNGLNSKGDATTLARPWQIDGQLASGGAFMLNLDDAASELQVPNAKAQVLESRELNEQLDPSDSALLLSFHLWRRLLVLGPGKYGEVRYVGTAPIPHREGLFDVLSATRSVTESLVYFHPETARIAAIEMFPDPGVDPCELLFDDYRSVSNVDLPHLITIRRGNEVFAEFRVTKYSLNENRNDQ